jgi:hypothetical protein
MRKLRSFLPLFLLILCSLTSAVGLHAAPQVMRNAAPYSPQAASGPNASPAAKAFFAKKHALRTVASTGKTIQQISALKANGAQASLVGYGTPNIQADLYQSGEDKWRLDGSSAGFQILLTNISAETTVTFASVTDDNTDFPISTTCTTLTPGQTCTITLLYTPATPTVCNGGEVDGEGNLDTTTITVTDNDPDGDNMEGAPGQLTFYYAAYSGDNGMTLDDLTDPKLNATALAQALVGAGVTVSNATYTGAARAAGTFSATGTSVGFNSGVVLSNGSVRNVLGPNCDTGITMQNGALGDYDLTTLANIGNTGAAVTTNDAAVLEFDFVPTSDTVSFQYVFASDEYNEFVFDYNDVFGFFLNGTNIALIPGTQTPVSINNVNNGNSTGEPNNPPVNPQDFVNNDFQWTTPAPIDTEMDGLTIVFTASATVTPGQTSHIKLAIADATDYSYDSNVFIKGGSFTSSDATLTPTSQAFGSVAVGSSSAPFTFTLANVGANTIDLGGIALTGPFTETDNCDDGLNAVGTNGSTCTIMVTFTPTASGAATGTLTVNYTTVGSNTQQTVTSSLTGTGTGGAGGTITVSPTSLTFTTVIGTTSAAQAVTITNMGTTAVTVSSVTVPGGGFAQTNNCTSIAASGTCTINVTFSPTSTEPVNGNLVINDSAAGSPHTVALSGTGVNSPIIISVAPGGSLSATSVPGGTAYYGLIITAVPGFSGTVQLSCTPSSPLITCTPVPSSITLGAGGTTEVAFAIQTYCKGTTVNTGGLPFVPGGFGGLGGGLALFVLALSLSCATWTFHRKPRVAVAFAGVLVMILVGAACSGGPAKGPNGVTPAGTYTLTLNATTNGNTVSLPNYLTLVVQ